MRSYRRFCPRWGSNDCRMMVAFWEQSGDVPSCPSAPLTAGGRRSDRRHAVHIAEHHREFKENPGRRKRWMKSAWRLIKSKKNPDRHKHRAESAWRSIKGRLSGGRRSAPLPGKAGATPIAFLALDLHNELLQEDSLPWEGLCITRDEQYKPFNGTSAGISYLFDADVGPIGLKPMMSCIG